MISPSQVLFLSPIPDWRRPTSRGYSKTTAVKRLCQEVLTFRNHSDNSLEEAHGSIQALIIIGFFACVDSPCSANITV